MTHGKPLVLTDIDDTLFQNILKVPEAMRPQALEIVKDTGDRVSVMTPRQAAFFAWIRNTCDIVPVTARGLEAFRKINLSFGAGWKVVANGAVVIAPDGDPDPEWSEIISGELASHSVHLEDVFRQTVEHLRMRGVDDESFHIRRYREHGHDHCVLLSFAVDAIGSAELVGERIGLFNERVHVHYNAGVLALTARPVSKKRAVEFVLSKIGDLDRRPVLAFGDSLSDLPFMSLGDFICAPAGSQVSGRFLAGTAA